MPSHSLRPSTGTGSGPNEEAAELHRAITRPRLDRGHFAFFRAVLQGLAPRAVWERYLPGDAEDARAASCSPGILGGADATRGVPRLTGWISRRLGK
ncbi:hypothetical protein [Cupriavidus consociatus]|uniref:hypothetical protein n=1 Tax=Cupriavidus consociatus TaxID=2821357 RepID=UPI001AE92C6E|nr:MULTISPECIES: hypothetical protein [unclassified Cupriavidus]MBP0621196.1 hypothetical protein [Cupriavidus sp. LEh25]MDK2657867.1 hypothetical protein [Cupriavidus sp. LEh21]